MSARTQSIAAAAVKSSANTGGKKERHGEDRGVCVPYFREKPIG